MTVEEFLQSYGGNKCVSIKGYCEEEEYDYYTDVDDYYLSDDNHYIPACIIKESWWNEVKNREIKNWNIIGGGMYKVELYIELKEKMN